VETIVSAIKQNDPYFPRPTSVTLWKAFSAAYARAAAEEGEAALSLADQVLSQLEQDWARPDAL
jgi:hypothetical protein